MSPSLTDLAHRLADVSLRDERRLRRRIDDARRATKSANQAVLIARLAKEVEAAAERVERRRSAVPAITYPANLPVSERRDEIADAIANHQVVIVAGETGSGKTTQLPKICAQLGRGVRGLIGHTQPRRLAARTVAERVAEELGVELGDAVGYAIRHTDKVSDRTLIKVMTDGILLAEAGRNPALLAYDTIIIDEAHERSLNIDFLIGYLKQLLPRRPDLKVIITSATIDSAKFSRHFDDAPVIEVSGRTYPVEIRYRPLVEDAKPSAPTTALETKPRSSRDKTGITMPPRAHKSPQSQARPVERDQVQGICDAVAELSAAGPGDILVFLSGEREIRDTSDALTALKPRNTEILPLFARLSVAEQHRVFAPHAGRRIVLATNVAETSLTVPGVRYVIDAGTARISRFSNRTKVQRLPIEPVSQASANQRAGRCGRVADGICIRLYSQEDFESRPEFTDPEIVRTNLASVLLRMIDLNLGDIAAFPFLDAPDRRAVTAGMQLLAELSALDDSQRGGAGALTPLGRKLARLPLDPRFGRMVLEAERNGCLSQVLIIVAALSIQDPRERPTEQQQAADAQHRRFAEPHSDFLTYLNLWNYLRDKQRELSSGQFRKLCRTEFLHYLRVREWQDLVAQLRQVCAELGFDVPAGGARLEAAADPQRIHVSLLAGLLSHIGMKDGETSEYTGARNARFAIFPGSALSKKPPRWVMAAELVETSRLWARTVARIESEWVESLAPHLVKREYSEPHWSSKQAAVLGYERVTLYGLPIVTKRKVNYARVDPELARELFIRHALVEGEWVTHSKSALHAFFHTNQRLLREAEELEDRVRQRGLVVDDDALFEFYDQRVGAEVVSGRHFDTWWKRTRKDNPELLTFDPAMLYSTEVATEDYPLVWSSSSGPDFPMSYVFEPGNPDDGVTVDVPLAALPNLDSDGLAWQVPGLRREIVTTLLRSLPKSLRRSFVPVPDYVSAIFDRLPTEPGRIAAAVAEELYAETGVDIPDDAWEFDKLPSHLRTTFQVFSEFGELLGRGNDLAELKRDLKPDTDAVLAGVSELERGGVIDWDWEDLPQQVSANRDGFEVVGYPAVIDEGGSAAIRVLATPEERDYAMRRGIRRLLRLTVPAPTRAIVDQLDLRAKLTLNRSPHRDVTDLLDDCADCAMDSLLPAEASVWSAADFAALRGRVATGLPTAMSTIVSLVLGVLTAAAEVEEGLAQPEHPSTSEALADVREQLDGLYYRGFIADTGAAKLRDLRRYLTAAALRLNRLREARSLEDAERDRALLLRVREVQREYAEFKAATPETAPAATELTKVRWMIEEFRVSLFAQKLGTRHPVSEKRIYRALDAIG